VHFALLVTLLLGVASAEDHPGVHVAPSHVGLYASDGACWSIAFAGPEFREQGVRKAADERFEKPSPVALTAAKRPVVSLFVWPESTLECGNDAPQALVVRDAQDTTTLAKIPLRVSTEARSNAFGVAKAFGEGSAEMTFAASRGLFDGTERVIYLLTAQGRHGGWRIGGEMAAVHDLIGWTTRANQAKRDVVIKRFEEACGAAPATTPIWMALDIIAVGFSGPTYALDPAELRAIGQSFLPCLERLSMGSDEEVRKSALKVLGLMTE
jgi:hypothetical protein